MEQLNLTIVGSGRLAGRIAPVLQPHHRVRIAGRSAGDLGDLPIEPFTEAVPDAQVLLLAVPGTAALEVAADLQPLARSGVVLLDATNALSPDSFRQPPASVQLARLGTAERLAGLGGWKVVKALNLVAAEYWGRPQPAAVDIPICTDHEDARAVASAVIESLGGRAVPAGGLDRAGYLEAAAALVMGQWFAGYEARQCFPELASFTGAGR